MQQVAEILRDDEGKADLTVRLEAIGAPPFLVELPGVDDLAPALLDLAVPHEDINPLVSLRPQLDASSELRWLLERCVHALVERMGKVGDLPEFPVLAERLGSMARYFYVFVFVATLPHVQVYHRSRGIADDVSRRTLADIGRNMAVNRMRHGEGGLGVVFWIMRHVTGAIYDLGRLQFERARLGNTSGRAIAAAGLPFGPGSPVLSVHIPQFSGPLSPAACDAAFARAKPFFHRHFPEESYDIAVCRSWLLDDQLAAYLPGESNIIQFQRRFQIYRQPEVDDDSTVLFVFGKETWTLDDLPRRTRLERAVVDHMRAGRHWHGGVGWQTLPQGPGPGAGGQGWETGE